MFVIMQLVIFGNNDRDIDKMMYSLFNILDDFILLSH